MEVQIRKSRRLVTSEHRAHDTVVHELQECVTRKTRLLRQHSDLRQTFLNGNNRYTHFNPAVGATYKLGPAVTAYGGISITNRTPNASEIECSDPLLPRLLPANLAGDPPVLRQVIAHTYELGLRGRLGGNTAPGSLNWNLGVFRTNLSDDIYAISTSVSSGFFQNIGATRRQGVEAGVNYRWDSGSAYINYSYVDATFESALVLSSASSPTQDADGNIQVSRVIICRSSRSTG